jgi:hypothetical protein
MKKILLITALSISTLMLSGCGKKTEQEQLDEVRNSFIYKNYKLASDNGLPLSLIAYEKSEAFSKKTIKDADACAAAAELARRDNSGFVSAALGGSVDCSSVGSNAAEQAATVDDSANEPLFGHEDLCIARILLAYGEMTADKPDFALAETDLIEESTQCNVSEKQIATSLRAVIFHRNEWPGLAQLETEKVKAMMGKAPSGDMSFQGMLVANVAFAGLAIRNDNWEAAGIHIESISLMLDEPWIASLSKIGIAFKEKRIEDGLQEMKRLSQDPSVPTEVQTVMQGFIADIEKQHGDVDSPLFMEKLITKVVWETAKSKGSEQWKALTTLLDENSWKDGKQSIDSAIQVLSEFGKKSAEEKPAEANAPQ